MTAMARVRVRVDPILPERTVAVPPHLVGQQNSETVIEFGMRSTHCRLISGPSSGSTVLLSVGVAERLSFEGEMRLNIRSDSSTIILGPLIGVIADTHSKPESVFGEQTRLFREISEEARRRGAMVFIFSPYDINFLQQSIRGYVAPTDGDSDAWVRRRFPFPKAVYDRSFYQPWEEKTTEPIIERFRRKGVNFVNSVIGDKWKIHHELSHQADTKGFMPETVLARRGDELLTLLNRHRLVYLKPAHGSQGRGIIRVEKRDNGRYTMQYQERAGEIRRTVNSWATLRARLERLYGRRLYLAQQGIKLLKHHGALVDLRIIVQKTADGRWSVSGMAARVGRKGSSVTNLHRGGHAVTVGRLLAEHFPERAREITAKIELMSCRVAAQLERAYGALGELGVDLGLDQYGELWYIESNPKPGRRVFILIGAPETRRKTITRPLEYAMNLAGFPPTAARRDDDGD